MDVKEFLKKAHDSGWIIIFLDRNDKIEQVLSHTIAKHRGAFHKTSNAKEKLNIEIDCELFKKRVLNRIKEKQMELEILRDIPHLYVNYEKDLKNSDCHQSIINHILDSLGLEHRKVNTKYRKVNVYRNSEIIVNFEEFKKMKAEISSLL